MDLFYFISKKVFQQKRPLTEPLINLLFKSSTSKMRLTDSSHFLAEVSFYFEGKDGRTKKFKTLTGIVYHNLLRKLVPLATMEYFQENADNAELL